MKKVFRIFIIFAGLFYFVAQCPIASEAAKSETLEYIWREADWMLQNGQNQSALEQYEEAYRGYLKLNGPKDPDTLSVMSDVVRANQQLGRYAKALELGEAMLANANGALGESHEVTLKGMLRLAPVYTALGRYQNAAATLERLLEKGPIVWGKNHRWLFQVRMNLAQVYDSMRRFEEASRLNEQNVAYGMETWGSRNNGTITAQRNLATNYRHLGRFTEALEILQSNVTISTEELGLLHNLTISYFFNLAATYEGLNDNTQATQWYEKALNASLAFQGMHPQTLSIMNGLARQYAKNEEYDKALGIYTQLVDSIEAVRRAEGMSSELRQSLFATYDEVYKQLIDLYVKLNQPGKAFAIVEMTKARTLLEISSLRLADGSGILTPVEETKIFDYENMISSINQSLAGERRTLEGKAALENEKVKLLQAFQNYRQTLFEKYPEYAKYKDAKIMDAESGRTLIPADGIFVHYVVEGNRVTALTLDSQGMVKSFSLGKIPSVERTAYAFIRKLQGKRTWKLEDGSFLSQSQRPENAVAQLNSSDELTQYLGEILLKPLAAELREKRLWIISAGGPLSVIPFETLDFEGKPAIAAHNIGYVQSLSMLNLLQDRRREYSSIKERRDLLAMGGALYQNQAAVTRGNNEDDENKDTDVSLRGNSASGSISKAYDLLKLKWGNLPQSEFEIDRLASIFGGRASIYKKENASEAKLMELNRNGDLAKYRYIAFATHGYFSQTDPGLSSIVLSQLNLAEGTDGYVTAIKWHTYKLKSDLMFLSACETGVGKVVKGEGVMGLPYALFVAGNTSTVFTLWKVVDESSARFSASFFAKIKEGKTHMDALSDTKREFMSDPEYSSPMYWAPYVLYGI